MPILPDSRVALVEFCELHVPVWQAAAAAIGLSPAQLTTLDSLTKAARLKYNAQQTAKNAARSATGQFYDGEAALRDNVALLLKVIKTFADTTNNPGVYDTAQIPAPTPPSPKGPPDQPTEITVMLNMSGAVTFRWKNGNGGTGAYYTIRRRLAGTSDTFAIAGTTDRREFTDETLPGPGPWEYVIQGFRTNQPGPESNHVVLRLGGGGAQLQSMSEFKMAA